MPKRRSLLVGRKLIMQDFAFAAAERGQHFFYIRIPEPVGPIDRGSKYEVPLSDALGELGEITGGGSQMGDGGVIAFCGIDVVVNHRDRGLKTIRACLESCGAPVGTIIEEYVPAYAELPL